MLEADLKECPICKGPNIETSQESVDIGVGVQYGPLVWYCHDCDRGGEL